MADDWDADDDWDTKEIKLPAVTKAPEAKPGLEPDLKRFDDEDLPDPDAEPSTSAPKPPPKKKDVVKKPVGPDDTPLDDPVAEKARQQRLIEQADYAATTELFGSTRLNLDEFLPKTVKDFDDLATALVSQYVIGHSGNKHYKSLVKALLKSACEPLSVPETKDVETSLAGLRAEKMKTEAAAAAAKKVVGKKANLNMGKQGPGPDLDDYDTYGAGAKGPAIDDDYDFM